MHVLAHLFLSGTEEETMVGNFMGDDVKGRAALAKYPLGIRKGILLHREIDFFTDTHEVVKVTKRRFHARFHHYAGVISDVLYDHFLALHWATYHPMMLSDFEASACRILKSHEDWLPPPSRQYAAMWARERLMTQWATVPGILRALAAIPHKVQPDVPLCEAFVEFRRDYAEIEEEFKAFFSKLQARAQQVLDAHTVS